MSEADDPEGDTKIVPGKLNENLNKRNEASNRKYRAFKLFIKSEKKIDDLAAKVEKDKLAKSMDGKSVKSDLITQ